MIDIVMLEAEERMNKAINSYKAELATIRTGRANPALLDNIMLDYYGIVSPLKQLAAITVPEATQLYIKPFDKALLKDIESAINSSQLGLTPQSDGIGVRLNIPQMTEERRRDLVKQVGKLEENAKVAIRNVRRDINDQIKKLDELTEDDEKFHLDEVQQLTDKKIRLIEVETKEKEKELLTI